MVRLNPLPDRDSDWPRYYAYLYLTGLVVALLAAVAALGWAAYVGIIDISASVSADVAIGWIIEYAVMFIFAVFALWTFVQIIRVTGVGFINGLISSVASIADSYELPQDADVPQPKREDPREDDGEA